VPRAAPEGVVQAGDAAEQASGDLPLAHRDGGHVEQCPGGITAAVIVFAVIPGVAGVAAMTSPASSRIATPSRRVMRGPMPPAGMQSRDRGVIVPVPSWYSRG
jgi:hypothetical protein